MSVSTHPVLGRTTCFAVIRRDPVTVEVGEQLGPVLHSLRVVVKRRAISHQKFRVRVGRGIIERQQAFEDPGYVQLEGFLPIRIFDTNNAAGRDRDGAIIGRTEGHLEATVSAVVEETRGRRPTALATHALRGVIGESSDVKRLIG